MGNISNRLKGLFNDYLNRLEAEKHHSYTSQSSNYTPYACRNPYYGSGFRSTPPAQQKLNFASGDDDFKGLIHFYEWSDVNRQPKTYYTLQAFENFLNQSNIYLASYQKELIRHIPTPYISCRRNGNLLIKYDFESLKHELESEDRKAAEEEAKKKGQEPYSVQVTRVPIQRPKVIEPESRWDEMHPEVGGCWGW